MVYKVTRNSKVTRNRRFLLNTIRDETEIIKKGIRRYEMTNKELQSVREDTKRAVDKLGEVYKKKYVGGYGRKKRHKLNPYGEQE
jgi:hypothetical protein